MNTAERPTGIVDPEPTVPHTAWGKDRVQVERDHLDPSKLDFIDPQAEANLQGIIDQINRADIPGLMEIQKNIADALEDEGDPKDRETVEKLKAINKRAEDLLRVKN